MCKNVTLSICILIVLAGIVSPAVAGLNDGLVAYFKLDETSGTFAPDSSGSGNHGTLVGPTLTWVEGRDGGALGCGAPVDTEVSDRLEFPTTGMSVTAGTVAVWANLADPQPATSGRYFFGHTTQPQWNNRIQIYMQEGTTPSRLLDIGLGASHTTRTDILELPTNEWLHVAMTWDNGAYAVYVDGEQVAVGSYSGLTALHSVANFGNDASNAPYEAFAGMLDEARVYNRALTPEEVRTIAHMQPVGRFMAKDPSPADKAADVPPDSVLGWTASEFAATHDLYLGTAFDDVNDASRANPGSVLTSQGQTAATYDPEGLLEYGQAYYWRVDEVNAAPDNTIFKGNVWSFTVEPVGYPLANVTATASSSQVDMGPENTVNGSGMSANDEHSTALADMWMSAGTLPNWIQYEFDAPYKLHELWVWNSNQLIETFVGFGAKDVTIEYSADGQTWTALEAVSQFAQATGAATYTANTVVAFGGVTAQYVKLTIDRSWGGIAPQTGLSEVRFFYIPVQARLPEPASAATGVSVDTALNWRSGREAVSHEVYFGTDEAAVAEGTAPAETVSERSYTPASLEFGTTYYWKVNEVGDTGTFEGDVWSFTTQEYAAIDGFETYNDDDNRIYDTWIDGWVNNTGSQVGYDVSPFAERRIIHGGRQSMPLAYNNEESPFYSEAEREFPQNQNWTANGADSLSLWVQGVATNSPANLYVTVEDSTGKTATAINSTAVTSADWTLWTISQSGLAGVNMSRVKKMYIGVGSRTSPAKGGTGIVYIDDIGFGKPAQ